MSRMENKLNLHQLQIFRTVAKHSSFSRAADELIISQPAISIYVKQLEKTVGTPLFEKVGRQVFLTEAGHCLNDYCERIFALMRETIQAMEALKAGENGTLRVAADTTAGVYVVPGYLGLFRRTYPKVTISLEVDNRSTVLKRLLLRETDMAIIGQVPDNEASLQVVPFLSNELVIIAPPGHRLATQKNISVQELTEETFLMREPGSGTRATAERFFTLQGIQIQVGMELGSNSAIKQAVANGLGIAIISRQAITLENRCGSLVILDVEGFPLHRYWHIVHLHNRALPPPAVAFKKLMLENDI